MCDRAALGILRPVVVNGTRDCRLGPALVGDRLYKQTMYIPVGMLVFGLICKPLVRPVADAGFTSDVQRAGGRRLADAKVVASAAAAAPADVKPPAPARVVVARRFVGIPLAWGVWKTLRSLGMFFH